MWRGRIPKSNFTYEAIMKKHSAFRPLAFSLWAVVVAVLASVAFAQPASPPATHVFAPSRPIEGRYIVVFKDSVSNPAAEAANIMRGLSGQVHHTYTSALKGFTVTLPDAALQAIRNNPLVDYVEQDQTVSLNTAGTRQTSEKTKPKLDKPRTTGAR